MMIKASNNNKLFFENAPKQTMDKNVKLKRRIEIRENL